MDRGPGGVSAGPIRRCAAVIRAFGGQSGRRRRGARRRRRLGGQIRGAGGHARPRDAAAEDRRRVPRHLLRHDRPAKAGAGGRSAGPPDRRVEQWRGARGGRCSRRDRAGPLGPDRRPRAPGRRADAAGPPDRRWGRAARGLRRGDRRRQPGALDEPDVRAVADQAIDGRDRAARPGPGRHRTHRLPHSDTASPAASPSTSRWSTRSSGRRAASTAWRSRRLAPSD